MANRPEVTRVTISMDRKLERVLTRLAHDVHDLAIKNKAAASFNLVSSDDIFELFVENSNFTRSEIQEFIQVILESQYHIVKVRE